MKFNKRDLKKLFTPRTNSNGEDNGQITIIGGSELFHGAIVLPLKVASRIVDMVFFASPEKSVGTIAESIKSKLMSFIWVPWDDLDHYMEKSNAILIGPGLMRYSNEREKKVGTDETYKFTRSITENLLNKFSKKRWVIDAGSLQVMDANWIPEDAILTPNKKEYKLLFGNLSPEVAAKKYNCIIVLKGHVTSVFNNHEVIEISGGNPGLTKGGTGDTQAGLTVALLAKNDPLLAACAASYIIKATADELQKSKGIYYNADDLSDKIPEVLNNLIK